MSIMQYRLRKVVQPTTGELCLARGQLQLSNHTCQKCHFCKAKFSYDGRLEFSHSFN